MAKDYNEKIGRQKDMTNGEILLLHCLMTYLFIIKLVIYF